jgi:hypothetical protein
VSGKLDSAAPEGANQDARQHLARATDGYRRGGPGKRIAPGVNVPDDCTGEFVSVLAITALNHRDQGICGTALKFADF